MVGLVKTALDKFAEGDSGALGVRPAYLEFQASPAPSGQAHQIQDAPAVGRIAVTENPNFRLEPLGQRDKPVGRSEVEAKGIGDLSVTTHAWHDLLSLPAPIRFFFH
jgi:hypothetical protein